MRTCFKLLAVVAACVAAVCLPFMLLGATTEAGHAPNRMYIDQDGQIHLNGSSLYLNETGTALSATESAFVDGVTAGTVTASKAAVVDANKDIASFRDVTVRKIIIGDSANDHTITIAGAGDEAASRTLSVPALGGNSTLAVLGVNNAFTGTLTTTHGVASGTARVIGGRASVQTAAGTAHTNSTDEAVLGSYSIPANTIGVGTIVRVRYQGIVTADNGATTLTVILRCGPTTLTGQALISHAATDTQANYIFTGEYQLVGRAAPGAAAACVGVGTFSEPAAVGGALKTAFLGSTNFATNGALLLEVTADWSAADSNSCRLDILNVEVIG